MREQAIPSACRDALVPDAQCGLGRKHKITGTPPCSSSTARALRRTGRQAGRKTAGRCQELTPWHAPANATTPIHYQVGAHDLQPICLPVTLTIAQPQARQVLRLPVWIPGSYLVREFARHLQHLQARQGARACSRTTDKASWTVNCQTRRTAGGDLPGLCLRQFRAYCLARCPSPGLLQRHQPVPGR